MEARTGMIRRNSTADERGTPRMVTEILAGSLLYNLILILAVLIFYRRLPVLLGLFVGMLSTVIMLLHMASTVENVLEQGGAAGAEKAMVRAVYLRKGVFLFLYMAVLQWFPHQINPLAVIAGALGLKAGVYLRPVIRKLLKHW